MKKFWILTLLLFWFATYSTVQAATIVVVGQGEVSAPPDVAKVQLQIRNQNKDPAKARTRSIDVTKKIVAELKVLGVGDADLSQSYYTFRRDRDRDGKDLGYFADNSISVRVSDFAMLPEITNLAIASGVTDIGQPDYSLADEAPLLEKARDQAYQNAQKEAEKSAKSMGLSLGKVVKVSVGAAAFSNMIAGEMFMGGGRASLNQMPALQVEPI